MRGTEINFNVNNLKLLNAVIYILQKLGRTDNHKICKILFYADKNHLNKHGRPVTGDCYIKMNNGPVPSLVYNILKHEKHELEEDFFKVVEESLRAVEPYYNELKNDRVIFDDKYFSETDLEELDRAIAYCRNKGFNELSDLTHLERAWANASINNGMDIKLFLDEGNKNKEKIIKDLQEMASLWVF